MQLQQPSFLLERKKIFRLQGKVTTPMSEGVQVRMGKEIIVLFENKNGNELPQEEWQQLTKILAYAKVSENDVVTVNVARVPQLSWSWLREMFPAKTVISFGDCLKNLGRNFQTHKNRVYHIGDVRMVRFETLAVLPTNPKERSAMVPCIDQLFPKS